MRYLEIFTTALSSLRANKLRTALTMLGIIIGILAVTLVLIISKGATVSVTSKVSSLGTNLLRSTSDLGVNLDFEDARAIAQQMPGITAVAQQVATPTTATSNVQSAGATLEAVTSSYGYIYSLVPKEGSFFSGDDVISQASVVVLGHQVANSLFGAGSHPVGQVIKIGNGSFYVVGVLPQKGSSLNSNPDKSIYMPVTTAMSKVTGNVPLDAVDVLIKDSSQIDVKAKELKQFILERHNVTDPQVIQDYTIYTSKDLLATVTSITKLLSLVLAGVAGISLIVGGIGIMNIMLVTVTERTGEIGLLKAIGAKRRDILTQFLVESVILTVIGGLMGIALGIISGFFATRSLSIPFTPPLIPILVAVAVSIFIGLVFGVYPARRAARMNPIDALRHE